VVLRVRCVLLLARVLRSVGLSKVSSSCWVEPVVVFFDVFCFSVVVLRWGLSSFVGYSDAVIRWGGFRSIHILGLGR
jgi:hypothetical protein